MRSPKVISALTLTTAWALIQLPRACAAVALQARTALDVLLCHETAGDYWTMKSGAVLTYDLEGAHLFGKEDTVDLVRNGAFTGNADLWTVPAAPWTYNTNKVDKDANGVTPLSQIIPGLIAGKMYKITCTISNYTVASVRVRIGGGNLSEAMEANGTFINYLFAGGANALLEFVPLDASRFSIGTISMVRVDEPFLLAKAGGAGILEINSLS